jgi:hypothetical protein
MYAGLSRPAWAFFGIMALAVRRAVLGNPKRYALVPIRRDPGSRKIVRNHYES